MQRFSKLLGDAVVIGMFIAWENVTERSTKFAARTPTPKWRSTEPGECYDDQPFYSHPIGCYIETSDWLFFTPFFGALGLLPLIFEAPLVFPRLYPTFPSNVTPTPSWKNTHETSRKLKTDYGSLLTTVVFDSIRILLKQHIVTDDKFFAQTKTNQLTYLLTTYLLTPWSRVLLEKLPGFQLVKKFPTFYGTRRFITAFTSARHLFLSWASSIQSIPPHPTSWRSILILSYLKQVFKILPTLLGSH